MTCDEGSENLFISYPYTAFHPGHSPYLCLYVCRDAALCCYRDRHLRLELDIGLSSTSLNRIDHPHLCVSSLENDCDSYASSTSATCAHFLHPSLVSKRYSSSPCNHHLHSSPYHVSQGSCP